MDKIHSGIYIQILKHPLNLTFTVTFLIVQIYHGLPLWLSGKESASAGEMGLIAGSGRFPWRRKWQHTLLFLPGESHGQRSLVGFGLWGCKRVRHILETKQQQDLS